jgi:hypothetical protein
VDVFTTHVLMHAGSNELLTAVAATNTCFISTLARNMRIHSADLNNKYTEKFLVRLMVLALAQ